MILNDDLDSYLNRRLPGHEYALLKNINVQTGITVPIQTILYLSKAYGSGIGAKGKISDWSLLMGVIREIHKLL